jgi:hypothetical protein
VCVGADDFLPVFIYLMTLSSLAHPAACIAYVQYLTPEQDMCGEVSYYVTTFESALYFIARLQTDVHGDAGSIRAGFDVASAIQGGFFFLLLLRRR